MRHKLIFLFLLSCAGLTASYAQPGNDKSQLEKERQEIQKELKEIQSLYESVKGQTKQTLSQLNVLNKKISIHMEWAEVRGKIVANSKRVQ